MDTSRLCLVSKKLENDRQIKHLIRTEGSGLYSGWVFLAEDEGEDTFYDSDRFLEYKLSEMILREPLIRPFLKRPVGTVVKWDEESLRFFPIDSNRSLTVDDQTYATNPGEVKMNPLRWISNYPQWPVFWHGALLISLLGITRHWAFSVFTLVFLFFSVFYWLRVRDHFKYGDANPGIVISADPCLIATSTNLTKGGGHFPVIKVIKKQIPAYKKVPVRVGTKTPTVALYSDSDNENDPFWGDFDPKPALCATGNILAIEAIMTRFNNETWQELEKQIKQLPCPPSPGLYRVDRDTSDWIGTIDIPEHFL